MVGSTSPNRLDGTPHELTVVIPTWNRSGQVTELVANLLAHQDDPNFNLIVVDDGSTDDTLEQLGHQLHDPRLRVAAREHAGVSPARNHGVAMALTPWVTFVDSDDEVDHDWIRTFHGLINERVEVVSMGRRLATSDGEIDLRSPRTPGAAFGNLPALWLAGAFAIRRDLFLEVGGYCTDLDFSENTDLALRIAARDELQPVRTSSIAGAHYTVNLRDDRYDPAQRLRSAEHILRDHADRLALQPNLKATYEAMAGVAAHRLGNRRTAVAHLGQAIRAEPLQPKHHLRLLRSILTTNQSS